MGYKKQTFIDYPNEGYTILKAEHLNHIEDGISKVSSLFPEMSPTDFGKQLFVNATGDGFLVVGNTSVVKWENLLEYAELSRPGYIAGKGVTQSNGTILYQAAGSFYTYINIPIKENTVYYLGGPESNYGYYARFINWQTDKYTGLNASGQITNMTNEELSALTISMVNGTNKTEKWVSPAGAKYCTVSYYDLSQGGTELNYFTTVANPEDRVDKVINNNITVTSSGKWNLIEEAEIGNAYWFAANKNGENYQGGGFYTFYNIPVTGGTTYYLGPSFEGKYTRFINWSTQKYILNDQGMLQMTPEEISAITRSAQTTSTTEAHKAPLGAKYCSATFYVGYDPAITKETCYFTAIEDPDKREDGLPSYQFNTSGVPQATLDQINQNTENINILLEENKKAPSFQVNTIVQKTRQPIVNFQFDDGVAGDVICKQIFDDFGYKCDFAITSKVSGEVLDRYLDFQKQGFHILSHSVDGSGMGTITDESDKQTKINKMLQSYIDLKAKGFDIQGWVTPSSSLNTELYPYLAKIYDYGFGTGQSSSVYHVFGQEKYIAHMSRIGIESNLIYKAATNNNARNNVLNYISTIWGVSASAEADADGEYQTVTITEAPFSSLIDIASFDGYADLDASDGSINETGLNYLKDIWGVSIEDNTLVVNAATLSLTPTFKRCCEREGMKNIRNYIDQAISKNAFISFYAHNTYTEDNTENGYGINLSKYTREILSYCQKVEIKVLNSKEAINEYFAFRYTDYLDLLTKINN